MKASTLVYVAAGAAGIGLAIALLRGAKGAKEAAGKVIEAVNPASPNNVAYKAANVITETLTGAPAGSTSVGSWLYDFINPNVPKADAPTRPTPRVPSIDLGQEYAGVASSQSLILALETIAIKARHHDWWLSYL